MNICRPLSFIAALMLMLASGRAFAEITAYLDRSEISFGETVRLIIESKEADNSGQPDLSVLDQNFQRLGTSTSHNISFVNGRQTYLRQWVTELDPKSPGAFTIPSISMGRQSTPPIRLTVLPADRSKSGPAGGIFIEMETADKEYYVQQQISLGVKLYLDVNLIDGTLADPAPKDTDVRRTGQDIQYGTTIDNRDYRVVERRFALFPGSSGILEIPPIRFQGVVQDNPTSGSRILNNLFNQGKRISAKSNSLSLNIKPPAPGYTGRNWLPAKQLTITDLSGDSDDNELTPGQPFNRNIQITAVGLTAEQLPEISIPYSDQLKQYPDKTNRKSRHSGQDIIGSLTQNIAFIAAKAGDIRLPEISINWWNTETDSMETAILPEKSITVIADKNNQSADSLPGPGASIQAASQSGFDTPAAISSPYWKWATFISVFLWLATSAIFWKFRTAPARGMKTGTPTDPNNPAHINIPKQIACIKRACLADDAGEVRKKLIQLSASIWRDDHLVTVEEFAKRVNSKELTAQIIRLNRYLYHNEENSGQSRPWHGRELAAVMDKIDFNTIKSQPENPDLPQLYPV